MPEFADDTSTELERKVRALQWVCVVETVSYLILFAFMITGNRLGVRMFGSVHGLVFLGFAAMVLGVYRAMGWSVRFVVAAIVLGPIGAVLVYETIRRHGVPAEAQS